MVQIDTVLTPSSFTAFSNFNSFSRRGRGWAIALFPAAMTGMGVVHRVTGSQAFFWVFTVLGIALPLAYVGFYRVAVRGQIKAHKLDTPRVVYRVSVDERGISVSNAAENASYPWETLYRAYLRPDCAYLYVTAARAFILPYDCVVEGGALGGVEELHALVRGGMDAMRVKTIR